MLEIKDKTKHTEFLKIAPFKNHIKKTKPHKHNSYFEIIYLSKGTGTHTIDSIEYKIEPPLLFTVRKEQVHYWDIKSKPEGYVIIIKKQYIEDCLDIGVRQLFSKLSAFPILYPQDRKIENLIKILIDEHQSNLNNHIIDGLLKALLGKILQSSKPAKFVNKNTLYNTFKELLSQEKNLKNSIAFYANQLNTTPQNLNAICRKEANQSASAILSEYIISEAKRLLHYTDLSITEISDKLDFKDNSHFTKYFKRFTSITPSKFRQP